jgi:hypothetical protein
VVLKWVMRKLPARPISNAALCRLSCTPGAGRFVCAARAQYARLVGRSDWPRGPCH